MADTGDVTIVHHADGTFRLTDGQSPPQFVAFSEDLVDALREGLSPWAGVEVVAGCETIIMRLTPETLRYRLTGGRDIGEGLIGERVREDGTAWAE